MLDLYAATGGDAWVRSDNWNGPAGTECSWFGVTCDDTQSHVTELALGYNNLTGQLPPLTSLTQLEVLALGSNQIAGPVPDLASFPNIKVFILSDNFFAGQLPPVSGAANLRIFHVSNNLLSGSIPDLAGMSALYSFLVDHNQLTGGIPSLAGLGTLTYFFVNDNQLGGQAPDPAPTNLGADGGNLCPNHLQPSDSSEWDSITGVTPWYYWCVTLTVPVSTFDPLSFSPSAPPGQAVTVPLIIGNEGGVVLNWTVIASADHCLGGTVFSWLALDRQVGTTAPSEEESVRVTFDAALLPGGIESGSLCVGTNDPSQPLVEIPVVFTISNAGADAILIDGFDGSAAPSG